MQRSRFIRHTQSLLSLYEQNYMLFRLVLPELPQSSAWFVLESADRPDVYVRRVESHPYTSEWLLGHVYANKRRMLAPDYAIRVYHDARLVEASLPKKCPVNEVHQHKLALNRALFEWLEYCHRYGYHLNQQADVTYLENCGILV